MIVIFITSMADVQDSPNTLIVLDLIVIHSFTYHRTRLAVNDPFQQDHTFSSKLFSPFYLTYIIRCLMFFFFLRNTIPYHIPSVTNPKIAIIRPMVLTPFCWSAFTSDAFGFNTKWKKQKNTSKKRPAHNPFFHFHTSPPSENSRGINSNRTPSRLIRKMVRKIDSSQLSVIGRNCEHTQNINPPTKMTAWTITALLPDFSFSANFGSK